MSCNCISEMDTKLAEKNGRLSATIGFSKSGHSCVLPTIEVEKINPRGNKPPLAIPSFCPFCGKSYIDEVAL